MSQPFNTAFEVGRRTSHAIPASKKLVFPSSIQDKTHSIKLMKRFIAITASTILYRRYIFSSDAYEALEFGDMELKILNKNTGIEGPKKFINWMEGAFDAIEKKYLRRMILVFMQRDENGQEVANEIYRLSFEYDSEGEMEVELTCDKGDSQISVAGLPKLLSDGNFNTAVSQFLKRLMNILERLDPLPVPCYLTMRLFYTNATPLEYEPSGFAPAADRGVILRDEAKLAQAGSVGTAFHGLKLDVKTALVSANKDLNAETPRASESAPGHSRFEYNRTLAQPSLLLTPQSSQTSSQSSSSPFSTGLYSPRSQSLSQSSQSPYFDILTSPKPQSFASRFSNFDIGSSQRQSQPRSSQGVRYYLNN